MLSLDSKAKYNVKVDNYDGEINLLFLPKYERERINIVKEDSVADYFIGNYRWSRSEYHYNCEMYILNIDGAKVLTVFKTRQ